MKRTYGVWLKIDGEWVHYTSGQSYEDCKAEVEWQRKYNGREGAIVEDYWCR